MPSLEGSVALELSSIKAAYGDNLVLRDTTISVGERSIVALLGPNGAGKTTLMRVAAGLIRPLSGQVTLFGKDVTNKSPSERVCQGGLSLVPEGRGIFRSLTVAENLLLFCPPNTEIDRTDLAIEAFPLLATRLNQVAGSLSGGEQQMLSLARVYLSGARVVLVDEVSMGLAPLVVDEMFEAISALARQGVALLMVEQYVTRALAMCDHVYILNHGSIQYSGRPDDLDEEMIWREYLGVALDG
jgi:branched-chain amino acid transport system ATP-binding protein